MRWLHATPVAQETFVHQLWDFPAWEAIAHRSVRELVEPLSEDRPLGTEVQRLARHLLEDGELLARVRAAVA